MSLKDALAKLQRWTSTTAGTEFEYPNWSEIYTGVEQRLDDKELSDGDIQDILYALARDHEGENILDMLSEKSALAHRIANQGIDFPDAEGRWQTAVLLGRLATPSAIAQLRAMVSDPDAYVRRRALLALREHDADFSERTAIDWLNADCEYARMVALDTLAFLKSPALKAAAAKLAADPSWVVQDRLKELMLRSEQ